MRIYGVDFTCAPHRAKPITIAVSLLRGNDLIVEGVERVESFAAFEAFLQRPGPWIGGFDFPFSLPRELVRDLGWPASWNTLVGRWSNMAGNMANGVEPDEPLAEIGVAPGQSTTENGAGGGPRTP